MLGRGAVRKALDEALERPVDPASAEGYDREHWGMSDQAIQASASKDDAFAGASY